MLLSPSTLLLFIEFLEILVFCAIQHPLLMYQVYLQKTRPRLIHFLGLSLSLLHARIADI